MVRLYMAVSVRRPPAVYGPPPLPARQKWKRGKNLSGDATAPGALPCSFLEQALEGVDFLLQGQKGLGILGGDGF